MSLFVFGEIMNYPDRDIISLFPFIPVVSPKGATGHPRHVLSTNLVPLNIAPVSMSVCAYVCACVVLTIVCLRKSLNVYLHIPRDALK